MGISRAYQRLADADKLAATTLARYGDLRGPTMRGAR